MEQLFYRFWGEDKKDIIKVLPKEPYNSLKLFGKECILIEKNVFTIVEGTKTADLLQLNDGTNILISNRLRLLMEEHQITGWECFPVVIDGLTDKYFGFQNIGKAGEILNLEELNNLDADYIEFDINTWSGTDIFNLEGTLINACTPRVKELFEANKITNVEIFRL